MSGKERVREEGEEIAVDRSWSIEVTPEAVDEERKVTKNTKISPTIFWVPDSFLASKGDAYEPNYISLGPFHYQQLPEGDDRIKRHYLDRFIKRNREVDREAYIREIKSLEQEARSAYPKPLEMDSNEFAEMMLRDCCFVLEFLLVEDQRMKDLLVKDQRTKDYRQRWLYFRGLPQQQQQPPEEEDPITGLGKSALPLIRLEILMLENQLPLCLLQKLLEKAAGTGSTLGPINIEHLIGNFFHNFSLFHKTISFVTLTNNIINLIKKEPQHHLLHLFLNCMRPSRDEAYEALPGSQPEINCAKELSKLKVKLVKKDAPSVLDIGFRKPRFYDVANLWGRQLEIPQLSIDDNTDTLFRNLIVFEQCFPEVKDHVSAYARFMGSIMQDKEDVVLLGKWNIVKRQQSDENVVSLFKQLSKEMRINLNSSYLGKVVKDVANHCEKLREHREKPWNKCWHSLKKTYFRHPWLSISVAAGIIIFVLAFLQTIYTILGYKKQTGK